VQLRVVSTLWAPVGALRCGQLHVLHAWLKHAVEGQLRREDADELTVGILEANGRERRKRAVTRTIRTLRNQSDLATPKRPAID
jgi:hypothetical protein